MGLNLHRRGKSCDCFYRTALSEWCRPSLCPAPIFCPGGLQSPGNWGPPHTAWHWALQGHPALDLGLVEDK